MVIPLCRTAHLRLAAFTALLLGLACGGGGGDGGTPPTPVGSVHVTVVTTGSEPDPDGYSLRVATGTVRSVPVALDTVVTGLAPGLVTVTLDGLAPNCTSQPSSPFTVTVIAESTVNAGVTVTCVATRGSVVVSTVTTGADLDPDGYSAAVDGGTGAALALTGQTTIGALLPGAHTVTLNGVAPNCHDSQGLSRGVTIAAGVSVPASFTLNCSLTTGFVSVTTVSTGAQPDPDGYSLGLDGTARAIGTNATLVAAQVSPGSHTLQLSGLAANCTVGGTNPRSVTVVAAETLATTFTVTCPAVGTLRMITQTSGLTQDPNGYDLLIDGLAAARLLGTDTFLFTNLVAGSHQVIVGDVSGNCGLAAPPTQNVTITQGGTTTLTVTATCTYLAGPKPDRIVFTRATHGPDPNVPTFDYDLYEARADGSGVVPLLVAPGNQMWGSWSPDGTTLAYAHSLNDGTPGQVRLRAANGTNDRLLATGDMPAWSPDGARLAYVDNGIWVVDVDGGNPHQLFSQGGGMDQASQPAWSPDGSRLLWCRGDGIIVIGRSDGQGTPVIISPLTVSPDRPAWSPDGTRVTFSVVGPSPGGYALMMVNADGTNYHTVVDADGDEVYASWSPDGSRIAFTWSGAGLFRLHTITPAGAGLTPITPAVEKSLFAAWAR
jgi:hypothetical protein